MLETYSGHRTMNESDRAHLYAEIRRRVGDRPIRKHYLTTLDVAPRDDAFDVGALVAGDEQEPPRVRPHPGVLGRGDRDPLSAQLVRALAE